jgi:hypothetical protein
LVLCDNALRIHRHAAKKGPANSGPKDAPTPAPDLTGNSMLGGCEAEAVGQRRVGLRSLTHLR